MKHGKQVVWLNPESLSRWVRRKSKSLMPLVGHLARKLRKQFGFILQQCAPPLEMRTFEYTQNHLNFQNQHLLRKKFGQTKIGPLLNLMKFHQTNPVALNSVYLLLSWKGNENSKCNPSIHVPTEVDE